MLQHPHTGRCILVAAVALFGAGAAHAASTADAGKDASPAISLTQLGGTWKNVKSGVNVRIEQGAAGWEVWFSTSGQARIALPEKNRPAIKIDGRNFTCSYSVTLPTAQTMKWDLTQGQPETQCLTGVFTRLGPAPSEVKQAAPMQKVTREPAVVEPPPEATTPRHPEPSVEHAPASGSGPIVAPARSMHRHAAVYRRSRARIASRYHAWRVPRAARWRYAASRYRPYRYFHYRYRWYVVLFPRCGCR